MPNKITNIENQNHPLAGLGLAVENFKCFGATKTPMFEFSPINIILGRNNSGKSALVDFIDLCVSQGKNFNALKHSHNGISFSIYISQTLTEKVVQTVFRPSVSSGDIGGRSDWDFGKKFVGEKLISVFKPQWVPISEENNNLEGLNSSAKNKYADQLVKAAGWPLEGCRHLMVDAERDVRPEASSADRTIGSDGSGTTNLVRAFINDERLERNEVEFHLLRDLNIVYRGDCEFTRISSQENHEGKWEIFLREEEKGDIRLSQSGSSLKSIFIVLSMLRLMPIVEDIDWGQILLSIDEPENNLHPSLLRRLLDFLAAKRIEKGFTLFVTTHSPIGIDWSSKREDSKIFHVQHDGITATVNVANSYALERNILDDLDIRASDILQANGIIWVEGPTERIYLKKWIEIVSHGELEEGTHFTIMFYGGRLLSHLEVLAPEDSNNLISLLSINRNVAVIIDSDRYPVGEKGKKPRMHLNETKRRVRTEILNSGGFVWITEGREIENYIPNSILERMVGSKVSKSIDQYTKLPEHSFLKKFKENKIVLAEAACKETEKKDIVDHLDLWMQVEKLCSSIKKWNSIGELSEN